MDEEGLEQRVAGFASEVAEVRQRAERCMHEYDLACQLDVDREREHIRFNVAVISYISKLYPYLQDRTEFKEENLLRGSEKEITLKDMITRQGSVRRRTVERKTTFGTEEGTEIVPALHPPTALRNAVHTLNTIALDLGFMPEPDSTLPKGSLHTPRPTES